MKNRVIKHKYLVEILEKSKKIKSLDEENQKTFNTTAELINNSVFSSGFSIASEFSNISISTDLSPFVSRKVIIGMEVTGFGTSASIGFDTDIRPYVNSAVYVSKGKFSVGQEITFKPGLATVSAIAVLVTQGAAVPYVMPMLKPF